MGVTQYISLIPLPVCLLPNERKVLTVDENRYQDLIDSLLLNEEAFGIPCNNISNTHNIGSLVTLEKVSSILGTNEISIQVQCTQLFKLTKFFYRHSAGRWPGGEIQEFNWSFQDLIFTKGPLAGKSPFEIADRINLSAEDKLTLLKTNNLKKAVAFLESRNKYFDFILDQELAVRDNIYLN